jgi:uncharacterized membrane protein
MSSGYGSMFDGMMSIAKLMVVLICVFVPLGAWKLVEIIIWCFQHVHVGIQ